MKETIKLFLFIPFFLSSISLSYAQHEEGTKQIRIGLGTGVYLTERTSTLNIGAISISNKDSAASIINVVPFEFYYGISKRFSIGLKYSFGNYIEDSLQAQTRKNKINTFGVSSDFYFINKSKFNMYLNAHLDIVGLRIYNKTILADNEYKYSGFGPGFNLGTNILLLPFLGLNLKLGYDSKTLNLKELFTNGNQQNLSNYEEQLKSKGLYLGFGFNVIF